MNSIGLPFISVVIPTYNHANFLQKSLGSVLSQTYQNFEVIVVDNSSTDNTDEVVYSFEDSRVQLIKINNNGVIAASRNLGIRRARGKWIAFLDSDDLWYPRKLEVCCKKISEKYLQGCDVITHDELVNNIITSSNKVLHHGPHQKEFYLTLLKEGNRLSPSATMVRKEFIDCYNISFSEEISYATVEDYGFWLDLARHNAYFIFIHEVLGEYVIHGNNSSARFLLHWSNTRALLHDHVFGGNLLIADQKKIWSFIDFRLEVMKARELFFSKNYSNAFKLLLKTLLHYPHVSVKIIFLRLKKKFISSGCE